jgi:ADP-heptose:LPS heptosyltransferase
MVSMDSANMHFASAVGTPVVSIWGATHPDFGFYGYGQDRANAMCANLPCQPCSAYGNKPCRFGDHRCMTAITPEMVMKKIETLIAATQ